MPNAIDQIPIKITLSGSKAPIESTPVRLLHSRIDRYVREFAQETGSSELRIKVILGTEDASPSPRTQASAPVAAVDAQATSATYVAVSPHFTMEKLVFPESVKHEMNVAIKKISDQLHLYETWGLKEIDKNPKSAINLFGPPGTGKTAAAHAMASLLEKKIIIASYADIESKYHGEGPKNVQAIFKAAVESDAVLFIDEADSLLSQRLANVTQGSEQAINSMRSQLLINMESHRGLIVFATNFAKNYDRAFDTRLVHLHVPMPGYNERLRILRNHLPQKLPLAPGFSCESIAEVEDVCGRDIKNAVIAAAVQARIEGIPAVTSEAVKRSLVQAIENRKSLRGAPIDEKEKERISALFKAKMAADQNGSTPS